MFKVTATPTFSRTVKVKVPDDEGGFRLETLRARFRVVPVEDMEGHDFNTPAGVGKFLEQAVADLEDLADAHGQPIECDDRVRAQVFGTPYARAALLQSYLDGINGAKEGN